MSTLYAGDLSKRCHASSTLPHASVMAELASAIRWPHCSGSQYPLIVWHITTGALLNATRVIGLSLTLLPRPGTKT